MSATSRFPETQIERTSLAWQRTGLALAGTGLVLARVAAIRGSRLVVALCAGMVVTAGIALVASSLAGRDRGPWLRGERSGGGLSLASHATVVTTVGLAAAGVVLVATT